MVESTKDLSIEEVAEKYVEELDLSIYYVPVDEYKSYFLLGL